jgi:hypothetical protein
MIKITPYLYVLSSWSLVAEDAVREVREYFGDRLDYDCCPVSAACAAASLAMGTR